MAAITLIGVHKIFDGGRAVLADIDLAVRDGERLALVGPSGSGKSTLLRIVAGLERPTFGRVLLADRDITRVPPEERDLAMVFQSYALYPHKSVRENLAFGLRVRHTPAPEIERRVAAVAASLGLDALLDRRPAQLSGGQRQRVALGRAIARDPKAFLFDEPLSNLDPQRRAETRAELIELHHRLGATMIHVTHDQEEAMTLGQRVAVLREGRLEQVGPPDDLYRAPANTFVAGFIGSPSMNLVREPRLIRLLGAPAHAVTVGVRPHDIAIRAPGATSDVPGNIDVVEHIGHAQIVRLSTDADPFTVVAPPDPRHVRGERVGLWLDPTRLHFFDNGTRRIAMP